MRLAFWKNMLTVCALIGGDLASEPKERIWFRDLVGSDQIYLNKKDRFIKFDTKDNELEIDLGVSVPVVNIPLGPKTGRHGAGEDSLISISAPGVVVAGALFLTSFLVLPLLFPATNYRSGKTGDEYVLADLHQVHDFYSRRSTCMENLICWTAKKVQNSGRDSLVKWLDDIFRAKWLKNLTKGTFIEEAIKVGRSGSECFAKYVACPILKKILNS